MPDLYERQKTLDIRPPASVTVVGCGGVGSWVAYNLALTGVNNIVIIDHDTIELHNLNRTPFCQRHVGMTKVAAMTELICDRRPECIVTPIAKRVESMNHYEMQLASSTEIVIDCRDISTPLPDELEAKAKLIMGGYDGFNITVHINPNRESVWGDEPVTYTTVPSWLVPPQMLAAIITMYLCCKDYYEIDREVIKSFDIRDLINWMERA